MDKEAVFKKLRFGQAKESLVVNALEEFLQALEGANFDAFPDELKTGKYGYVQVFASSQAEMEEVLKSVAKAGEHDCLF